MEIWKPDYTNQNKNSDTNILAGNWHVIISHTTRLQIDSIKQEFNTLLSQVGSSKILMLMPGTHASNSEWLYWLAVDLNNPSKKYCSAAIDCPSKKFYVLIPDEFAALIKAILLNVTISKIDSLPAQPNEVSYTRTHIDLMSIYLMNPANNTSTRTIGNLISGQE